MAGRKGSKRQRQLARQRYERRLRRQAERAHRRRRLLAVGAAAVGVVIVVVGGYLLATGIAGHKNTAAAGATRQHPSATSSAPSPTVAARCSYTDVPRTPDVKDVGRPPQAPDTDHSFEARLTTNRGDIVIRLDNHRAACAVNSFTYLAGKGFYNDTRCHRLVTTGIHVLQCGDPTGTGRGGPGYRFADENLASATYPRGTVAMANSGPDTNGSQFFIVDQPGGLDRNYSVLGTVIQGLDIVDKVAAAGNAPDGVAPKEDVIIKNLVVTRTTP